MLYIVWTVEAILLSQLDSRTRPINKAFILGLIALSGYMTHELKGSLWIPLLVVPIIGYIILGGLSAGLKQKRSKNDA